MKCCLIPKEFFEEIPDKEHFVFYIERIRDFSHFPVKPNFPMIWDKLYFCIPEMGKFIWFPNIKLIYTYEKSITKEIIESCKFVYDNWTLTKTSDTPKENYFLNTYFKTDSWETKKERVKDDTSIGQWVLEDSISKIKWEFSIKRIDTISKYTDCLSICTDEKTLDTVNRNKIKYQEDIMNFIFYGIRERIKGSS